MHQSYIVPHVMRYFSVFHIERVPYVNMSKFPYGTFFSIFAVPYVTLRYLWNGCAKRCAEKTYTFVPWRSIKNSVTYGTVMGVP